MRGNEFESSLRDNKRLEVLERKSVFFQFGSYVHIQYAMDVSKRGDAKMRRVILDGGFCRPFDDTRAGHLVFHDFDLRAVADRLVVLL